MGIASPTPSASPGREKASPPRERRAKGLASRPENLAKVAKAQSVVDEFCGAVWGRSLQVNAVNTPVYEANLVTD